MAIDTRVITRRASEQVIRHAFELCRARDKGAPKDGKKRVTAIVKDNVLKGCQMFRDVFFEIGEEYPDIEKDTAIVDAFTQWLIGQPEYYDVCVTTNMFGDIVTDLASTLQGGMGMAVGAMELAFTESGLASMQAGGFDRSAYKALLQLPDHILPVSLLAVGRVPEGHAPGSKARKSLSDIAFRVGDDIR